MCLIKNKLCVRAFIKDNPGNEGVIVYKVLREFSDHYKTLYQCKTVELNSELVPEYTSNYNKYGDVFYGGCIHVYLKKYDAFGAAKKYAKYIDHYNKNIVVVKCKAKMEDLVAVGVDFLACFEEVQILDIIARYPEQVTTL